MEREKAIYKEQALASGKPENIVDKIIEGRVTKFYGEVCLLNQPYIKDDSKTVQTVIDEMSGKLGENVQVSRFTRFEIGQN